MSSWRLAGRTLDLARPIGAGIVNVTVDSMFEGARSGTPEQAVADGLALAEAGFEMLDLGAVAAKAGPPVAPKDEAAALVPAVEGLATALRSDRFHPLGSYRNQKDGNDREWGRIVDSNPGNPDPNSDFSDRLCARVPALLSIKLLKNVS